MSRFMSALLLSVTIATAASDPAAARVSRIDVSEVKAAFGGKSFGAVGSYEWVRAVAHFEVDPNLPANAGVKNLQRAPRNAQGLVEMDTDVWILRPTNPSAGNGHLFYEPVNRGRPLSLGQFNGAAPAPLDSPEAAGDGFLMKQGYTIVFSGWQPGYPLAKAQTMAVGYGSRLPDSGSLKARLPIARGTNATPITGRVIEGEGFGGQAGDRKIYLTYPAANVADKGAYLRAVGSTEPLRDGSTWRYVNELEVGVMRPAGAGGPVEFVYEAKDPFVYGLALTSMRDLMSFFRHETAGNPLRENGRKPLTKTFAFGASQTGRTVKTLVYLFNDDEQGRQVVDGAFIHISGASLNSQNEPFGRPGDKYGAFPFTYAAMFDPISRQYDGVLMRCSALGTCPKIIHTDSESEMSFGTSLLYTDTKGEDVQIPDNVRVYLLAGTQHGPARKAERTMCKNLSNPMPYAQPMRSLLVALDQWVTADRAPPASRHPMRSDGTLISLAEMQARFPKIPQMVVDTSFQTFNFADPASGDLVEGLTYPDYRLKTDADGNTVAGIHNAELMVPLGTYTGWNPSATGSGLCPATGSFVPFEPTKAAREKLGDPRLSIAERYPTVDAYVAEMRKTTQSLVAERLMLPEDAKAIMDGSAKRYAEAMSGSAGATAGAR
ncbi:MULTISPECIES: alpha/beta hydrolase domain-containing protein [unclassified Sphingobium]|uniref:alpha/beta hydrolase domain-containing protein n=1 Tax=unclassified Sphingobium TaxID=2611147 RepID=UPI00222520BF|nr:MULTISPECIES: alpha/beta hydrolase domain-containing protein [unclassified Sphingobium]MCW2393756.1 hypothetical protein [Sphingobium sp. B8D3B]MCW2417269.1 hypothetical protein [Sphingobium sp. B8D3C]